MVRTQAAFHSDLLMCVSRSQNPMQSASDLPPPPGALGADSLGLTGEEGPGDSARLGCTTPPVENCVGSCGDSGAMGASSGVGAAIADGGRGPCGGGVGIAPVPEFARAAAAAAADALPFPALAPRGGCMVWGVPTIAGGVITAAEGARIVPPAPDSAGRMPEKPIPGASIVLICEVGVMDRATARACPPPRA